jgi:hypothetical protein
MGPLECCGEKWAWKEVGYLGQSVDKDLLVFCPLCGNYKRCTEGQLDTEEVWQWLGVGGKREKELEQLNQRIDNLTKKYRNVLLKLYEEQF